MRINPTQNAFRSGRPDPVKQAKLNSITRKVAIAVAAASTYAFIFKILFF